jgi:hypothetical protein
MARIHGRYREGLLEACDDQNLGEGGLRRRWRAEEERQIAGCELHLCQQFTNPGKLAIINGYKGKFRAGRINYSPNYEELFRVIVDSCEI